jgi:hypothetical protein
MLRLIWLAVHSPDLDLASPNSDPAPNLDPTLRETRQTLIRTVRQLAYAEQFVEWRLLCGQYQPAYLPPSTRPNTAAMSRPHPLPAAVWLRT